MEPQCNKPEPSVSAGLELVALPPPWSVFISNIFNSSELAFYMANMIYIAFKPPGQAVLNRLFQVPQKNSVPGLVWLKWDEKKIHGTTHVIHMWSLRHRYILLILYLSFLLFTPWVDQLRVLHGCDMHCCARCANAEKERSSSCCK